MDGVVRMRVPVAGDTFKRRGRNWCSRWAISRKVVDQSSSGRGRKCFISHVSEQQIMMPVGDGNGDSLLIMSRRKIFALLGMVREKVQTANASALGETVM